MKFLIFTLFTAVLIVGCQSVSEALPKGVVKTINREITGTVEFEIEKKFEDGETEFESEWKEGDHERSLEMDSRGRISEREDEIGK